MPVRWYGAQFEVHIEQRSQKVLEYWGPKALEYATGIVAVDTGALRDSLFYKTSSGMLTIGFPSSTGYGIFVEYGTRKMSAQPFLRPTIDHIEALANAGDTGLK